MNQALQEHDLYAAISFAATGDSSSSYEEGVAANSRLYRSLPADIYHADREYKSSSMLKPLLISPAHYQDALLRRHEPSDEMNFGTLTHALVLEPHKTGNEFAVFPGLYDGRSKDYKEFVTSNPDRIIVDEPTFVRAKSLADKILSREVFGRPFGDFVSEGIPEASIYFEEPTTGIKLRIRVDLYHPEYKFDLKTTRFGDGQLFKRDCLDRHYDLQAFMYTLGCALYEGKQTPTPFLLIGAESQGPHAINTINITPGSGMLSNGAKKFKEVISVLHACTIADHWPDLSADMDGEINHWQSYEPRTDWKSMLNTTT